MESSNIKKAPTAKTENANELIKDTVIKTERERFKDFLLTNCTTCTVVAETIYIKQKNLTRYKAYFEKLGLLQVVNNVTCPSTGRRGVQMITMDSVRFNKCIQTTLF
jgi:hypothetical protein